MRRTGERRDGGRRRKGITRTKDENIGREMGRKGGGKDKEEGGRRRMK